MVLLGSIVLSSDNSSDLVGSFGVDDVVEHALETGIAQPLPGVDPSMTQVKRVFLSSRIGRRLAELKVQVDYEIVFPAAKEDVARAVASQIVTIGGMVAISINEALAAAGRRQLSVRGAVVQPPSLVVALASAPWVVLRTLVDGTSQPPLALAGQSGYETKASSAASIVIIVIAFALLTVALVVARIVLRRHCGRFLSEGDEADTEHPTESQEAILEVKSKGLSGSVTSPSSATNAVSSSRSQVAVASPSSPGRSPRAPSPPPARPPRWQRPPPGAGAEATAPTRSGQSRERPVPLAACARCGSPRGSACSAQTVGFSPLDGGRIRRALAASRRAPAASYDGARSPVHAEPSLPAAAASPPALTAIAAAMPSRPSPRQLPSFDASQRLLAAAAEPTLPVAGRFLQASTIAVATSEPLRHAVPEVAAAERSNAAPALASTPRSLSARPIVDCSLPAESAVEAEKRSLTAPAVLADSKRSLPALPAIWPSVLASERAVAAGGLAARAADREAPPRPAASAALVARSIEASGVCVDLDAPLPGGTAPFTAVPGRWALGGPRPLAAASSSVGAAALGARPRRGSGGGGEVRL